MFSAHLDDANAATVQQRQCAHHTTTGGEEKGTSDVAYKCHQGIYYVQMQYHPTSNFQHNGCTDSAKIFALSVHPLCWKLHFCPYASEWGTLSTYNHLHNTYVPNTMDPVKGVFFEKLALTTLREMEQRWWWWTSTLYRRGCIYSLSGNVYSRALDYTSEKAPHSRYGAGLPHIQSVHPNCRGREQKIPCQLWTKPHVVFLFLTKTFALLGQKSQHPENYSKTFIWQSYSAVDHSPTTDFLVHFVSDAFVATTTHSVTLPWGFPLSTV